MQQPPHYRVELPRAKAGEIQPGRLARLFVTYAGEEEREVPAVRDLQLLTPLDGVIAVQVVLFGSVEVMHRPKEPEPEPAELETRPPIPDAEVIWPDPRQPPLPPDVAIPPPGTITQVAIPKKKLRWGDEHRFKEDRG